MIKEILKIMENENPFAFKLSTLEAKFIDDIIRLADEYDENRNMLLMRIAYKLNERVHETNFSDYKLREENND